MLGLPAVEVLGQVGSVEFSLQPRSVPVPVAQVGDELVNARVVGSRGAQRPHLL